MSKLTQKDMLFTGLEPSSRIALIKQLEKAIPQGNLLRKQLAIGEKIEMEHTSDPKEARKIAMDHLKELPDYYTRLKKMEKKGKSELGKAIDECMGMIDAELADLEKAGAWGVPTPAAPGGMGGGGKGTGGRGSERPGHKYIRREGQAGAYKYIYRDEQTGKEVEGGEPELQHLPHEKMEYGKQYHLADGTTVDWHGKNPAGQHIVGVHSGQPGGQAGQQLKLLHGDTQFRTSGESQGTSEKPAEQKQAGTPPGQPVRQKTLRERLHEKTMNKPMESKPAGQETKEDQKPKSQSTSTDFRKQMSGLTEIAYTKTRDIPDDVRHQAERVMEGIRNVADHLHKIKTPDEIGNMQSEMIEQFKKDISDSVDKKTMNEIFGESDANEKSASPAGQETKFKQYDNVEHDGKFWSVSKVNPDGTFEISRATSPGESKSAAISKTVKAGDVKPWSFNKTKEGKTETAEKPVGGEDLQKKVKNALQRGVPPKNVVNLIRNAHNLTEENANAMVTEALHSKPRGYYSESKPAGQKPKTPAYLSRHKDEIKDKNELYDVLSDNKKNPYAIRNFVDKHSEEEIAEFAKDANKDGKNDLVEEVLEHFVDKSRDNIMKMAGMSAEKPVEKSPEHEPKKYANLNPKHEQAISEIKEKHNVSDYKMAKHPNVKGTYIMIGKDNQGKDIGYVIDKYGNKAQMAMAPAVKKETEKSVTQSLMHNVAGRMFYGLDPDSRRELEKALGGGTGHERPGHKYIRREGYPGDYRYIYKDAQGKEHQGPIPSKEQIKQQSKESGESMFKKEQPTSPEKPAEKPADKPEENKPIKDNVSYSGPLKVVAFGVGDEVTVGSNRKGKVLKEYNNGHDIKMNDTGRIEFIQRGEAHKYEPADKPKFKVEKTFGTKEKPITVKLTKGYTLTKWADEETGKYNGVIKNESGKVIDTVTSDGPSKVWDIMKKHGVDTEYKMTPATQETINKNSADDEVNNTIRQHIREYGIDMANKMYKPEAIRNALSGKVTPADKTPDAVLNVIRDHIKEYGMDAVKKMYKPEAIEEATKDKQKQKKSVKKTYSIGIENSNLSNRLENFLYENGLELAETGGGATSFEGEIDVNDLIEKIQEKFGKEQVGLMDMIEIE